MRIEWLLLSMALIVLAAVARQGSLLLVAIPILMFYLISEAWAKYALRRVEYTRHLSSTHAFFGDEVTFELRLANRKFLPLPWVQIEEELDEHLALPEGVSTSPSAHPGKVILRNVISVGWYQKVKMACTIRCGKRGFFTFGPTRLASGDYFRLRVQEAVLPDQTHLTVYPRILPLDVLGILSRDPFGDIPARHHLFEDPVLVASVRDYAAGDPSRRIHWKATARVARLQTKVFEHTTSTDVAVFLDVRTVKHPFWGEDAQLLEAGCITAASIANHAVEQRYPVGLYVNQYYPESTELIRIRPSSHREQLRRILEALAMTASVESMEIDRMVMQEGACLPWGSTLVVVTAVPTPALVSSLKSLHQAGRPVAMVLVGTATPEFGVDSLTTYRVPAEIASEKADQISLTTLVGVGS